MMTVLGIRESRRAPAQNGKAAPPPPQVEAVPQSPDPALAALLEELLPATGPFVHLCVVDAAGCVIASATKPLHVTEDLPRLWAALHALAKAYPRAGLARAYVQDAAGTAVLVGLPAQRYLFAVAYKSAVLGQISMSIGKIAARVMESPGSGEKAAATQ